MIRFTEQHLNCFRSLSHDLNPLHLDPDYARRTQFGEVVVFGISSVLAVLGAWSQGKSFQLKRLHANFKKPLFLGKNYDLKISEVDGKVSATILLNSEAQTEISFEWVPWNNSGNSVQQNSAWKPHSSPTTHSSEELKNLSSLNQLTYTLGQTGIKELNSLFGLSPQTFPFSQLTTLAWSSYLAGMEYPGIQALYSALEVEFTEIPSSSTSLIIDSVQFKWDPRFRYLTIQASSPEFSKLNMGVFDRPQPKDFSLTEILEHIGKSNQFLGKKVFITGSARGFGSVLAKSFALQGAELLLNSRTETKEFQNLVTSLKETGTSVHSFVGDISNSQNAIKFSQTLKENNLLPDLLILNAFPIIQAKTHPEKASEETAKFVEHGLALAKTPCQHFLPLMKAGSQVVHVSSIYVSEPNSLFAHYIEAKKAVENYLNEMSQEYKNFKFYNFRPEKMLTDQTNVAFDRVKPLHPAQVAKKLIDTLINE